MELIEEYNKTATLEMLTRMFYEDDDPFCLREKISFEEIYCILSCSNSKYPPLVGNKKFVDYFPVCQAQTSQGAYDDYITEMDAAYDRGDYFHFRFNDSHATERMIINITNQSSSLKLSQSLLSSQLEAPFKSGYQIPTV